MSYTSPEVKNRWNAKNYDRVVLFVPKGDRELIKKFAEDAGKSTNQFIKDLIYNNIQLTPPPTK